MSKRGREGWMDHGAQEQDGGNWKRLVIDVDQPSASPLAHSS